MNRIICPVDFSKQSESALRFASELAHRGGSKVVIVHVEPPGSPDPDANVSDRGNAPSLARAAGQRRAATEPGDSLQRLTPGGDVEFERVLRVGEPAREIVRLASESGASQIVMGTHGRPGHHCVLIGSTAESVVRDAPCPVTVVRNEDVADGPHAP